MSSASFSESLPLLKTAPFCRLVSLVGEFKSLSNMSEFNSAVSATSDLLDLSFVLMLALSSGSKPVREVPSPLGPGWGSSSSPSEGWSFLLTGLWACCGIIFEEYLWVGAGLGALEGVSSSLSEMVGDGGRIGAALERRK